MKVCAATLKTTVLIIIKNAQNSVQNMMLGAFSDQQLIGLCGLISFEHHQVKLVQMYVKSSHQGQSVGKKLLNMAKQCLKQLDADTLCLGVYPHNTSALSLYEKQGFTQVGHGNGEIMMRYHRPTSPI
ncbi:GNAT family N-acetyltransferase [Celerinatantimonas yamalensis]|uniref:GNAT family N-acetyltransferase n=1 Tax=Celerinatantimonas yamalensis TaxID=559956 RepID=A0ABW9GAW7_9GAMM